MTVLIVLGLVALGVLFDRLWLWARAADRRNLPRLEAAQSRFDISERRRRAEEQMRRIALRGRQ
ncbi:hypothetical protein GCM10018980_40100 [Streptomyces capoamus]|uniref:Uncharacterized protein n=1 Tax=Streptomyces capoamus TaxID=68183 RepID=A0A919EWY1_9ACTN|nr:hypothetical protein [Streptomyces capoamus]GGW15164.1 hypothetical protein GCM10010501_26080 [Streptomyces libani subsp. rufus]GHG54992.1 hypothetical protein GCM10018980_40100 [Streptomyces capoamus]